MKWNRRHPDRLWMSVKENELTLTGNPLSHFQARHEPRMMLRRLWKHQRRWISTKEGRSQEFIDAVAADEWSVARPYSEVPGPRPLPLIGNTWRLLPVIGQYQISDLGKVSRLLYDTYGMVCIGAFPWNASCAVPSSVVRIHQLLNFVPSADSEDGRTGRPTGLAFSLRCGWDRESVQARRPNALQTVHAVSGEVQESSPEGVLRGACRRRRSVSQFIIWITG